MCGSVFKYKDAGELAVSSYAVSCASHAPVLHGLSRAAVTLCVAKALGTLTPIVRQLATEKKDFV